MTVKKWQYKTVALPRITAKDPIEVADHLSGVLNELGEDGWELAATVMPEVYMRDNPVYNGSTVTLHVNTLVFKREV